MSNGKYFPTCSLNKIATAKNDNVCNPKAEVATGTVNSLLGAASLPKSAGTPCNPGLDVWNAGGNKVVFFFTAKSASQCGGLQTGATAPFYGYVSYQGKNMTLDVPQPQDISVKVANLTGRLLIADPGEADLEQADDQGQGQDGRLPAVGRLQGRQASVDAVVLGAQLPGPARWHDEHADGGRFRQVLVAVA